ncbi:DgyrCDS8093 [Dimorphilus gyrociliatus]|uniref:DgyrCDS8093 n=1 Tax=Dimorphilus gyrociliatus TaxID=2664684 RepID=A0A7I8VY52_9ANNE|nr:DgyrCDS8093 [Dimorphilus gyrociliatus]
MGLGNGSFSWSDLTLSGEDTLVVLSWFIELLSVFFGTFGNLLVIFSVLTQRSLWSSANMLVVQLAIFDFGISTVVQFTAMSGMLWRGEEFYARGNWKAICKVFGLICAFCCCASPGALTVISFNRWLCITKPQLYPRIFNRRGTTAAIIFIWLYGSLRLVPYISGRGSVGYDYVLSLCVFSGKSDTFTSLWISIFSIWIPISVVALFNVLIFGYVHSIKKSLRKISNNNKDNQLKEEIQLAKTLSIVSVVLFICLVPLSSGYTFDKDRSWSRPYYLMATAFYHLNSSLNPILYAAHHRFRKAYLTLFIKIFTCCGKRESLNNESLRYSSKSIELSSSGLEK